MLPGDECQSCGHGSVCPACFERASAELRKTHADAVAALQARVRELEADLAKTREAWVDYGANGTEIIAGLRQELAAAVSRERELDAERGRLQGDLNEVSNRCMTALGDGNDRNRWREGEHFVAAVERMAVGARDASGILHRILFNTNDVPAHLIPDLYAAHRALTGEK